MKLHAQSYELKSQKEITAAVNCLTAMATFGLAFIAPALALARRLWFARYAKGSLWRS